MLTRMGQGFGLKTKLQLLKRECKKFFPATNILQERKIVVAEIIQKVRLTLK